MKTTGSIFTNITLGLLIAGSMVACNSKKVDTAAAAATTPPSADKEAIVYVNSDTLLFKYDYAKDMAKRLGDKGKKAEGEIIAREQAFQREVDEYQKATATMAADQRLITAKRLTSKEQEVNTYRQNATAEFQHDRDSENNKLYDRISGFAKDYAKEKGYKLVLTYSKANPTILFGDPSLDVTADVVKKLNEVYAKEKK